MGVNEILAHYGIPKRSGRYPYGSGKEPSDDSPRAKIIASSKQKIKNDVEKYNDGGMEASERFATYAYEDAVAISKANFGNDSSKWTKAQKEKGAELEEELIAYYDEYIDIVLTEMKKAKHTSIGMNFLKHFGMPKRSGRYPWGSGADPDPNSPRGKKIQKQSDSVTTAKKILSDKSEFDKMATKDLQDLVVRIGYESQLRKALAVNAEENRSFIQKAVRKLGSMAVKQVSDFAMQKAQSAIKDYLSGRSKQAEEIKKVAQETVDKTAQTISDAVKTAAKNSGIKGPTAAEIKEAWAMNRNMDMTRAAEEYNKKHASDIGQQIINMGRLMLPETVTTHQPGVLVGDVIDLAQNGNIFEISKETASALYNQKRK